MSKLITEAKTCKLSVCISTRNRAKFIGQTLEGIVCQLTDECEIIVFDGASTDGTTEVVKSISKACSSIKYYRQEENDGLDRGFDHAVERAQGEYCWLLPDDDLVKPNAITKILAAIEGGYSVIVANSEFRSLDMTASWGLHDPLIKEDCAFAGNQLDQFFERSWNMIRYIGSTILKRDLWLSRTKDGLYGTYWIHVGVIFKEVLPGPALVIAEPQVSIRLENQSWLSSAFYALYVSWPQVMKSLALSSETKARMIDVLRADIRPLTLCWLRTKRQYSMVQYKQYVRPLLGSTMRSWVALLVAVLPKGVCCWITATSIYNQRRHLKVQSARTKGAI